MASLRLSRMELQIMNALWTHGECSVRQIQETFAEPDRPAFNTVQTMVTRLEAKKAVRITKRIGKANIFEAAITRRRTLGRMMDDLLGLFGSKPVVAHMVKTGQLTMQDVKEAEQELQKLLKKGRSK
jgi:BlaI family transcriptional regulator, penicillinase repressor